MKVVVALGGNALLPRGGPLDSDTQGKNLSRATEVIAQIAEEHDVVLVHGSGPQVGLLALRGEESPGWDAPLDVLSAEIEGTMGYMIQRALRSRLPQRSVVTLLTQIVVDQNDPAFDAPTKPIGPFYTADEARVIAKERGWAVGPDGDGWRRLVPSPTPLSVLELEAISDLLSRGHLVVCAGGGGLPVVAEDDGQLTGVEAVVDKDYSAALIGVELHADILLLLTGAPAIYRDWPDASDPIREISSSELLAMDLPDGSMGPKAEAAARFVEVTGGHALIGSMDDALALISGEAGTRVYSDA